MVGRIPNRPRVLLFAPFKVFGHFRVRHGNHCAAEHNSCTDPEVERVRSDWLLWSLDFRLFSQHCLIFWLVLWSG